MANSIFNRDVRARERLELFLVAAVSSVLLVRLYLQVTGYPQIGGDGLHIAHMLWGGLLMLAALAITFSFVGARAQRISALLGGVGFGVFIDEVGKFVTDDNNYFYQPAIGIIYAIFVILYLIFSFLSREQVLSSREYQLNALSQLEEAIVQNMDRTEKARVATLLAKADQHDPLTKKLQSMLADVQTIPPAPPHRLHRLIVKVDRLYERFWHWRNSGLLVRWFFAIEALLFIGGVSWALYGDITEILQIFTGTARHAIELAVGQLASAVVAAGFVLWGMLVLPRSRLKAYEQFRRATLINLLLTQFFAFARIEFAALPGFFFSLVLLGLISYAIRQEQRVQAASKH